MGSYGLVHYCLFLFPVASIYFNPIIYNLALLSIISASLTTLRQLDLKKIIAYSSIAHMSIVVLGIFSFNIYGILGGIFLMFSHGLTAAGLFFLVGICYDRFHTRLLLYMKGLCLGMPLFAIFF